MTRRPFGKRYSVMPSMDGPRVMPPGNGAPFCADTKPVASSRTAVRAQRRKRNGMVPLEMSSVSESKILPRGHRAPDSKRGTGSAADELADQARHLGGLLMGQPVR